MLRRSNFTRQIAKWGTRLRMFDILYKLRSAIKGQVLADFIVEFTPEPKAPIGVCRVTTKKWSVYVDGASNIRRSGIEIVMVSLKGVLLEKSLRLGFRAFNNEAEYEAVIFGLRAA